MSKQLKLRRGTTAQHSTFTGAEGEVTVDTTKDTLVVHDGTTAGGIPLATEASLASLTTTVGTKAADSAVVKLTGDQTVAGVKTFSGATTVMNGNVGVGTSSPSAKLDVRGIARINEDNAGTKVIQLRSDWADVGPAVQVVTNNDLLFVINGSERARIDTGGQRKSTIIGGGGGLWNAYDCRAWVNFNGTGTVAIRGSGNVSSITDVGTGTYTVNLTTAMPDTDYAVVGGSGSGTSFSFATPNAGTKTTSTFLIYTTAGGGTIALGDASTVCAAVFR